jgi:hypothetical protein
MKETLLAAKEKVAQFSDCLMVVVLVANAYLLYHEFVKPKLSKKNNEIIIKDAEAEEVTTE